MRSRPGSWTDDKGRAVKHKSQARFRDYDGHVRPVSAYGKTKTAAERALLKKLQDRAKTGRHAGELTAMHKMNDLIDLFEKKFTEWVKDGTRSALRWSPVPGRGELGSQSAGRLIGSLQETVSRGVSVAPSTPTPRCAATRSAGSRGRADLQPVGLRAWQAWAREVYGGTSDGARPGRVRRPAAPPRRPETPTTAT
ncbi:hypothetical protein [Kribbella pratensis]|uniref:hypothetical protein n=1 Tax=Kribbella pratensis TaxID=2512112 RepID=UPI001416F37E|nr:hypothetical protein [Kribbella pratensis]